MKTCLLSQYKEESVEILTFFINDIQLVSQEYLMNLVLMTNNNDHIQGDLLITFIQMIPYVLLILF